MQKLGRRGLGAPTDLVVNAYSMLGSDAVQQNIPPYWWLEPRSNTKCRQPVASVAIPAISATPTEVLKFQVPAGFRFVLRAIMHTFQTSTSGSIVFVNGSGDLLWTVDVDTPVGSTPLSGYGLPDLVNMAEQRGSLQEGYWRLEGYTVFEPYQTLRYKVTNVASGAVGAPNFTTCGLFGWLEQALTEG